MTNFYGKNDIDSTIDLFFERADYRLTAYDTPSGPDQVRNLNFVESSMYGCINTRMDTVYPIESYMKYLTSIQTSDINPRAIDFVADAFSDLVKKFDQACRTNIIPTNDPFLSHIKAVRGFVDPFVEYSKYIENLMDEYINDYLVSQNKKQNVLKIKDFINNLHFFIRDNKKLAPLTFTSWQRSRLSSIFTSGLAISIADLPIDDDKIKEESFLDNPIYPFYLNICKEHGFLISHNAPWVLVADVLSAPMMKYSLRLPYIINSPQSLFEKRFEIAYNKDILLLKDLVLEYYNRFASSFVSEKELGCNCKNNTIFNMFLRRPVTMETLDQEYSHHDWLNFYVQVRNIEENGVISRPKINRIIQKAKNSNFSIDNQEDIGYINEEFRKTYKSKPGGLNSLAKKLKRRNSHIKPATKVGPLSQSNKDESSRRPTRPNRRPPVTTIEEFDESSGAGFEHGFD